MIDLSLGQVGGASVVLASALALYAAATGALGAWRRDARLQTSARYSAVAVFLAMTTAFMALEVALLTNDFSVDYVARHSSLLAPTWVKAVMLWGALEGSILLWAWLLSAYTAVLALTAPNTVLRPWALTIMQGVQLFFIGVIATIASPFGAVPGAQFIGPRPQSAAPEPLDDGDSPRADVSGFRGPHRALCVRDERAYHPPPRHRVDEPDAPLDPHGLGLSHRGHRRGGLVEL